MRKLRDVFKRQVDRHACTLELTNQFSLNPYSIVLDASSQSRPIFAIVSDIARRVDRQKWADMYLPRAAIGVLLPKPFPDRHVYRHIAYMLCMQYKSVTRTRKSTIPASLDVGPG
jgi:hypothetical protein